MRGEGKGHALLNPRQGGGPLDVQQGQGHRRIPWICGYTFECRSPAAGLPGCGGVKDMVS